MPHSDNHYTTILTTVGRLKPVEFLLKQTRPRHAWFVCSKQTREIAEAALRGCDWEIKERFIVVQDADDWGSCYQTIRGKLLDLLEEHDVDPDDVLVDYTGATKAMTTALTLAGLERFRNFSYVGAEKREDGGIGNAQTGYESHLYQENPWDKLAIREIERVRDLWNAEDFAEATRLLERTAQRVERKRRFETLAIVTAGADARLRLDFKKAHESFKTASAALPYLFDGQSDYGLLDYVNDAERICGLLRDPKAIERGDPRVFQEIVGEIQDNALRCARRGRFEDAAARLYRAMEMQGQIWLASATDNVFRNGQAKPDATLPPALEDFGPCQVEPGKQIKLSLEQVFFALNLVDPENAVAKRIVQDVQLGESKSQFRQATSRRNTSMLAHGFNPISEKDFEDMKALISEFFGWDLSRETFPIPPFQEDWFREP